MFRTDLLSIIRSLNTVFTIGIRHTSYVKLRNSASRWLLLLESASTQCQNPGVNSYI